MANKKKFSVKFLLVFFFFFYGKDIFSTCEISNIDKLSLLYIPGVLNIPNLLKFNIYKNTNSSTIRDLTSIPVFLRNFNLNEENKDLKFNFFFSTVPD